MLSHFFKAQSIVLKPSCKSFRTAIYTFSTVVDPFASSSNTWFWVSSILFFFFSCVFCIWWMVFEDRVSIWYFMWLYLERERFLTFRIFVKLTIGNSLKISKNKYKQHDVLPCNIVVTKASAKIKEIWCMICQLRVLSWSQRLWKGPVPVFNSLWLLKPTRAPFVFN